VGNHALALDERGERLAQDQARPERVDRDPDHIRGPEQEDAGSFCSMARDREIGTHVTVTRRIPSMQQSRTLATVSCGGHLPGENHQCTGSMHNTRTSGWCVQAQALPASASAASTPLLQSRSWEQFPDRPEKPRQVVRVSECWRFSDQAHPEAPRCFSSSRSLCTQERCLFCSLLGFQAVARTRCFIAVRAQVEPLPNWEF